MVRVLWGGSTEEMEGKRSLKRIGFFYSVYFFTVYSVLGYRLEIHTNTVFLAPMSKEQLELYSTTT